MKAGLRLLGATLLCLLLVFLWLRGTDTRAIVRHVEDARLPYVFAIAVLSLLHALVRAFRWKLLIVETASEHGEPPPPRAKLGDLFAYTVIGYMVTFLIPGRLGEILRPALLWSRSGAPLGTALASVLLERLLDGVTLVAFLVAFVALAPEAAGPGLVKAATIAGALVVAGGVVLLVLHRRSRGAWPRAATAIARMAPVRFRPALARLALGFLEGFDVLLHHGSWWRLPLASLATWTPVLAALWCSLEATSLDVPLSAPLLLAPLTALGIAVPTPAGIGGFHALMSYGLGLLGVPAESAAAAAVVAHAAQVVPAILAGMYLSWRMGLGFKGLRSTIATAKEEAAP